MDVRQLGRSDISVSVLGLGCNAFGTRIGPEQAREVIVAALDEGVTFFDTADGYGRPFGASEEILGAVLHDLDGEWLIATKGGANPEGWSHPPSASRAWLMQAVEDSLRRLRVETIDFYQLHFPDPATPIEETLRAMDDMVAQGKVRAIGCSNFTVEQIREAARTSAAHGLARFESTQDEYHMLMPDRAELLDELRAQGMSLLPFFPLAGGLLTGKYRNATPDGSRFAREPGMGNRFTSERNLDLVEKLATFAESRGHTLPDLAIAWLLAQDVVPSVIAGATSATQVRANARSARWRMTAEEYADANALLTR